MSSPKNKEESRKRVLTLEVEGGGRTFDFSGEELKMTPEEEPDIKLHFLRFAKFLREPEKPHLKAKFTPKDTQLGTEENPTALEEVLVSSLDLEKFTGVRSSLNSGYLYVLDEADPAIPIEYEINENGGFSSISWEDPNKEIREKDGKLNTTGYHLAEYEAILWVAYSPVSWSKEFYDVLKGDVAARKKYMKKVECLGFLDGEDDKNDVQSNTVIAAHFTNENERAQNRFQQLINRIVDKEEKQREKHAEEESKKELIRPDMYVTLDDPVGCAQDINLILAEKIIAFKALVDAIQTGETWQNSIARISRNQLEGQAPSKEYSSLVSLAITCYSMVYNDNDSIDTYDGGEQGWNLVDKHPYLNYQRQSTSYNSGITRSYESSDIIGAGLDHKKLIGILGVEMRKQLREELKVYRTDFATYLQSRYCKTALDQYLNNLSERTIAGRGLFTEMLQNLFVHPYHFDRHLLLKRNYKENDELRDWIYRLINDEKEYRTTIAGEVQVKSKAPKFSGSDALYALLTKPIEVKEVFAENLVGFGNGLASTIKGKLSFHSEQIFATRTVNGKDFVSIKEKHQFVVTRLNKNLKVFGEEMFELSDNQIKLRLEALSGNAQLDFESVKKGKYTGAKVDVLRILKRSDGVILLQTSWGNHTLEMPIERSGAALSSSEVSANNSNQKLAQVLNSKSFKGAITFLQILNLKGAYESLMKEPSFKESVNLFGAASELTEASMVLTRSFTRHALIHGSRASKLITTAGIVGGVISSGMSFWDSAKAFDRRDTDAALAWAGAGVAFGISAAASLGTIAILGGPVGWIAAGIGLGFVIIANLLTDTDLETYFKNFLLSDHAELYLAAGEFPMSYSKRLLQNKEKLMGDDDYQKTMMNPADAEATLFDYIVCKEMVFTPINPEKIDSHYNPHYAIRSRKVIGSSFDVSITFFQFLNRTNCIEYKLYLFPNGLKKRRKIEIEQDGNNQKAKDSSQRDALKIILNIEDYKDKISSKTELLLAIRLKIDDSLNMHFPYPIGGEDRYLGARVNTQIITNTIRPKYSQNKDVKIAPLSELLNHKEWR